MKHDGSVIADAHGLFGREALSNHDRNTLRESNAKAYTGLSIGGCGGRGMRLGRIMAIGWMSCREDGLNQGDKTLNRKLGNCPTE